MTTRNILNYPGIKWDRSVKQYDCHLIVNNVDVLLGYFPSETSAYLARAHVITAIRPKHRNVTQPWQLPITDRRKKARH